MATKTKDGVDYLVEEIGLDREQAKAMGNKLGLAMMDTLTTEFTVQHKQLPAETHIDVELGAILQVRSDKSRHIIPEFTFTVAFTPANPRDDYDAKTRLQFVRLFDEMMMILKEQRRELELSDNQLDPTFAIVHNMDPHKNL